MNKDYQRDEHRVHMVCYHLVWCPRRRRSVLQHEIATRCATLIRQKVLAKGWTLRALAVQADHVHLFVQVGPDTSPADVVKACKGITSFHLRREFPELMKLPSMWTRSYFASTAGTISAATIQHYIQAQKGR